MSIRDEADQILHGSGLMSILKKYGKVYPVGSYLYDLMAWEDLDISIECEKTAEEMLYELSHSINQLMKPYRFEAGIKGENAMFYSCEIKVNDKRWNMDIWFRDRKSIDTTLERCRVLSAQVEGNPESRNQIIGLKKDLIKLGLYGIDKNPVGHYHSDDVYRAVLEDEIKTVEAFLEKYPLHET